MEKELIPFIFLHFSCIWQKPKSTLNDVEASHHNLVYNTQAQFNTAVETPLE